MELKYAKKEFMKAIGPMIKRKEEDHIDMLMVKFTMENSEIIKDTEMECISIKKAPFMTGNGKMTPNQEAVFKNGKMDQFTPVSSKMIKSTEKGTTFGPTVLNTKVIGIMAPLKVQALTNGQLAKLIAATA